MPRSINLFGISKFEESLGPEAATYVGVQLDFRHAKCVLMQLLDGLHIDFGLWQFGLFLLGLVRVHFFVFLSYVFAMK